MNWFGRRYPTMEDLEGMAEDLGCIVVFGKIQTAAFIPVGIPTIIIPETHGPLAQHWALAHELGHLVQHDGPRGQFLRGKDESQADRWAARALIPRARVRAHANASLDAFIGALSAHYEELPLADCPQRRLAARIALVRLKTVEDVA